MVGSREIRFSLNFYFSEGSCLEIPWVQFLNWNNLDCVVTGLIGADNAVVIGYGERGAELKLQSMLLTSPLPVA